MFPKLVNFVRTRKLLSFDPRHVTRSSPIGNIYTITIPCDRSEKRILPVHFRMTLVLTSEMVAQVIISIFRRSLEKLKRKFPSNQASMAMGKSSCKNTLQYLKSCCSPIGQKNTKDFSAQ